MPSGAKRRKNAKKKKERKTATAIIPNGNGEVKVIESDGGENSSPASEGPETQQNSFTKDDFIPSESVETEKILKQVADVAEIVEEAKLENVNGDNSVKIGVSHGSLKKSANGCSSREESVRDGSQVDKVELQKAEVEQSTVVTAVPIVEFDKDASLVKDAIHVVPVVEFESNAAALDNVTHEPESVPLQKSVGSPVAELKSKKNEEKVHPPGIFSDSIAENLQLSGTSSREPSRKIVTKQLPQSNILIGNGVSHADIQQNPENEPLLLLARGPVNKTSWTGCCGLFELFSGSSR